MSGSRSKSKEGFIRLGLKSPRNRKKRNQQNVPSHQLSHSFHSDGEKSQLLANSQKENQKSFYTNTERQSMEKSTYQQPNKLPLKKSPIQRQSQKNNVSKVIIYRQPSPQRKIIVNEKVQPLQSNVSFGNHNPIQFDLQRKNKILQQRIVQLHQDKQQTILRLHEENKKLNMDNVYLKQRMDELSCHLHSSKKEDPKQRKGNHPSATKIKSHNSLKNDVYVDKDEEHNETSILKKNSSEKLPQNSSRSQKQVSIKEVKMEKSVPIEQSVEGIRQRLDESEKKMKQMQKIHEELIETVRRYENLNEESNKKIHGLENNEKKLQEQQSSLKGLMEEIEANEKKMKEENKVVLNENQNLKNRTKQLKDELTKSQNELLESKNKYVKQHQQQIQTLKQTGIFLQQQLQQQMNQHEKVKQLLLNEKSELQQSNSKLIKELGQANKLLSTFRFENEALHKKADLLESEINDLKKIQTSKNIQTQGNAVVGECAKCRELLKTFMKLNSKTYQK